MAALFGIHVGNSSSCVAICKDDDRIDIVANDAGERVTPTIVQWTPTNCIVGRAAQSEQFRYTTCTIIRNKQLLYDKISQSELDDLRAHVSYKINKKDSNIKYELLYEGKQHHVPPKDIAALIYKKIYAIAEAAVGGNKEMNVVLCVPLYYTVKAIELVKDIATRVGFKVLQVVDEPSAAALSCGLGIESEAPSCHCLVYRVGGVSVDATILLVQNGMFTVLGSVHKYNIGGALFTEKLSQFLASEFKRLYKNTEITERGKFKLLAAAENAKQILSIQNITQCSVESIGDGYDLNCSVSRARFENIIAPYFNDIISPTTEVLEQTGLSVNDINKVLICGGTLKIPKLQEVIRNRFPFAEVISNSSPDELISLGAAKQAAYCVKYESLPDSLGIEVPSLSATLTFTIRQSDGKESASYNLTKNSVVPLRKRYDVPFTDKTFTVDVDILEKNLNLGSVSLEELEDPTTVNIEIDINKDGKLLLTLSNEVDDKKNTFKYDLTEMPAS